MHTFSYTNLAEALIIAIPILIVDQNTQITIINIKVNTNKAIPPYK